MSGSKITPTARETWLNVALAVARDGMPQPREFEVKADDPGHRVALTFDEFEAAQEWAGWLGLNPSHREITSNDGKRRIITFAGYRDGWHWTVTGYAPNNLSAPVNLAAQVTVAITGRTAYVKSDSKGYGVVLQPGERIIWSCPQLHCGYHIADGPVPEGEPTTAELIADHVEEHGEDNSRVLGRHPEAGLV